MEREIRVGVGGLCGLKATRQPANKPWGGVDRVREKQVIGVIFWACFHHPMLSSALVIDQM